jgi:uncharacterized protein (UPF0335 family)
MSDMTEAEQIARLNAESRQYQARLTRLEENQEKLEKDIRQLYASQEGTKTLVSQVLMRFDGFESKVFGVFQQMTRDSAQLMQKITTANSKATKGWQETIIDVIKLTVAALIGYLITKGGL